MFDQGCWPFSLRCCPDDIVKRISCLCCVLSLCEGTAGFAHPCQRRSSKSDCVVLCAARCRVLICLICLFPSDGFVRCMSNMHSLGHCEFHCKVGLECAITFCCSVALQYVYVRCCTFSVCFSALCRIVCLCRRANIYPCSVQDRLEFLSGCVGAFRRHVAG